MPILTLHVIPTNRDERGRIICTYANRESADNMIAFANRITRPGDWIPLIKDGFKARDKKILDFVSGKETFEFDQLLCCEILVKVISHRFSWTPPKNPNDSSDIKSTSDEYPRKQISGWWLSISHIGKK